MTAPARGEIWIAGLNPVRGHEQAGTRPVLVVSDDLFNQGPADLIIVIPITATDRAVPSHVPLKPPEGGLKKQSYIMSEAVRSISKSRLARKLGAVSAQTMQQVEDCLRILMRL
ncbi:MAG TPA: type II toxin-antitoxin system PemK/MazF family toxin [bacterium]|nr:type II toxin-antitoxin system PemK/MazF family toxin [bacterium]